MSVTSEENRTSELTTNGAVTDFDFDMLVQDESEVRVYYHATGDNYARLALNTDYGVTFTESGGTVTTDGYRAPLATGVLVIIRHLELTMETNWLYNDNHSEQQHQDDFDRAAIRDLQQQEELNRCPKFPITSDTTEKAFPEPSASAFIGWNTDGDELENKAIYESDLLAIEHYELIKPGNVLGMDGNWHLTVDSSGDLVIELRVGGVWTDIGWKLKA